MKRRDLLKGMFALTSLAALPASAERISKKQQLLEEQALHATLQTEAQRSCPHSHIMCVRNTPKQIICLGCQKVWDNQLDYCANMLAYRAVERINQILAP